MSTNTNSHWQRSGRRRGGWAHLRDGSGKGSSAAGSGSHREQRYPRALEAERARSASTHATRVQSGRQCM
eukprot:6197464-Pleurochrysis_carterae.AAC.1